LLLIGVVVDQAFTQPQSRDLAQASEKRSELLNEVRELGLQHVQSDELAALFNLDDVADLLDPPEVEPVAYVGSLIERTQLKRITITHAGTTTVGKLRKSTFTLHLTGSYPRLVAFTRAVEQGPRLAAIDVLTFTTAVGSSTLEAKLSLSIFDPVTR
jgi:hypothetical protein